MKLQLGPNITLDLAPGEWKEQFEYENIVLNCEAAMVDAHRQFSRSGNADALSALYHDAISLAVQHCLSTLKPRMMDALSDLTGAVYGWKRAPTPAVACKMLSVGTVIAHRIGIAGYHGETNDLRIWSNATRNLRVVTMSEWTSKGVLELAEWCAEIGGAHAH